MVCLLSIFIFKALILIYMLSTIAIGSNNKLYKIMLLIYYKFPLLPLVRFQTRLVGLGMCHTPCLSNSGFVYLVDGIISGELII